MIYNPFAAHIVKFDNIEPDTYGVRRWRSIHGWQFLDGNYRWISAVLVHKDKISVFFNMRDVLHAFDSLQRKAMQKCTAQSYTVLRNESVLLQSKPAQQSGVQMSGIKTAQDPLGQKTIVFKRYMGGP